MKNINTALKRKMKENKAKNFQKIIKREWQSRGYECGLKKNRSCFVLRQLIIRGYSTNKFFSCFSPSQEPMMMMRGKMYEWLIS